MPNEQPVAATTSTDAAQSAQSVLATSDQPVISQDESILDVAGAEEKAAKEAESKRLLDSDPATLTPEDVTKREGLLKEQEAVKAKALAEEKAKGVPDKYEFKLPDGMTLEPETVNRVTPAFKAEGLTQKQAQAMMDLWISEQKVMDDNKAVAFKNFLDTSAKETMAALGANAKTELAYVAKVKTMLSPETLEILNASGMGNQKSFILDLAKIGRMFSEEKLVDTGRSVPATKDPADILYPSMSKK
jgi:hypothetical protein